MEKLEVKGYENIRFILEEIKDLRTVCLHEALDFSPWLSRDDNISLLADAVSQKASENNY